MVPSLGCADRTVPSREGVLLSPTPPGCRSSMLLHSRGHGQAYRQPSSPGTGQGSCELWPGVGQQH